MSDFQVSRHPQYDEACRAFAQRHNMAKLAKGAGMNVQTLRNKQNPEQPHQFTLPELWLLTDLNEDSTLNVASAKLAFSAGGIEQRAAQGVRPSCVHSSHP